KRPQLYLDELCTRFNSKFTTNHSTSSLDSTCCRRPVSIVLSLPFRNLSPSLRPPQHENCPLTTHLDTNCIGNYCHYQFTTCCPWWALFLIYSIYFTSSYF